MEIDGVRSGWAFSSCWWELPVSSCGLFIYPIKEWRPRQPRKILVMTPRIAQVGNADPTALLQQILVLGHIDEEALANIENRGEPSLTAAAEFAAARYEDEQNREEQALGHIQRAAASDPLNPGLQMWCAMLMLNSGQTDDAVAHVSRLQR